MVRVSLYTRYPEVRLDDRMRSTLTIRFSFPSSTVTASGQRPSKWTASAPTKPLLDLAAVHDVSGSIEIDQIDLSSPDLPGISGNVDHPRWDSTGATSPMISRSPGKGRGMMVH